MRSLRPRRLRNLRRIGARLYCACIVVGRTLEAVLHSQGLDLSGSAVQRTELLQRRPTLAQPLPVPNRGMRGENNGSRRTSIIRNWFCRHRTRFEKSISARCRKFGQSSSGKEYPKALTKFGSSPVSENIDRGTHYSHRVCESAVRGLQCHMPIQSGGAPPHSRTQARIEPRYVGHVLECGAAAPL